MRSHLLCSCLFFAAFPLIAATFSSAKATENGSGNEANGSLPKDNLILSLNAKELATQFSEESTPRIEAWQNLANAQLSAQQAEKSSRPELVFIEDQPVVRFDGEATYLRIESQPTTASQLTLFVVAAPYENPGDFRGIVSTNAIGQRDYQSGFNLDFGPGPTRTMSFLNVEGKGFGGARNLSSKDRPFGKLYVYELVIDCGQGRMELLVNGNVEGERSIDSQSIALDQWTIGARYYTNGPGAQMPTGPARVDVAELLAWNDVLDSRTRESIRQQLIHKYEKLATAIATQENTEEIGEQLVRIPNPPLIQPLFPGFNVEEIPIELTNVNNVKYRNDGTLVTLGYNGDVHLLRDTNGDGIEDEAKIYYKNEGSLRGPLGLLILEKDDPRGTGVIVASKGKVSFLVDTDGDDRADEERVIASGWNEIPQNVDAVGIAMDQSGAIYFGLGTANYANAYLVNEKGESEYELESDRGTIQKISPDFSSRETVSTGIRFPVAIALHSSGDLFCTDQEGATWLPNGNPFDELLHIQAGKHYGFPPRHPSYNPQVIDEPSVFDYGPQHQSTCGMFFNRNLVGQPTFGPDHWQNDLFVCGESRGKIWKTRLFKSANGYIADSQLFACLQMLTVDACLAPNGDLVVACHSGPPDWGTGPAGIGKLFRIRKDSSDAAVPVATWVQSPGEIRIAFDRPVDLQWLKKVAASTTIHYGESVRAGDAFENLTPPYAVVQRQSMQLRKKLDVHSYAVTNDLRTVMLFTSPITKLQHYSITLGDSDETLLPERIDLDFSLAGVQAKINSKDATTPPIDTWLPHINLEASQEFLKASMQHEEFFDALAEIGGTLELSTQLDLRDILRPAVQPGAKLDYQWPTELVEILITGASDVSINSDAAHTITKDPQSQNSHLVKFSEPIDDLMDLHITTVIPAKSSAKPNLDIAVRTNEDSSWRPLPLRRFMLPWSQSADIETEKDTNPNLAKLTDGNWGRGRKLFHSENIGCFKCHMLNGGGGTIGPDLSNVRFRDYESVLRDIVKPSYAINPDYIGHLVQLNDGRVLTGVLQTRHGQTFLGDAQGRETLIAADEVEMMKPAMNSIMPTDLLKDLSDQQVTDLMTYLLTEPPHMPLDSPLKAPKLRTSDEVNQALAGSRDCDPSLRKLNIVLVAGTKDHGPGEHDYPAWQIQWGQLLAAAENVEISMAWDFPNEQQLNVADVLVFFQKGTWNDDRQLQMDKYFARGGGATYIHWAVNGDQRVSDFSRRIGLASRAGNIGYRHGPLTLDIHSTEHPIVRNFERLELYDESYWKLTGNPRDVTLLGSSVEDGQPTPQLWTYDVGKGRVFVSIPGHYSWTFDDPLFRILLLRGIAWSAGECVDRFNELVTLGARMTKSVTPVTVSQTNAETKSETEDESQKAGNEEVARIMREFEGRGDLGDGSDPATPRETIEKLKVADDLKIALVASEPDITQPIHISFDSFGRMWVVEYRQYPFPAGLKVVRYDQHLRAVFDKVPQAPPNHVRGADRVSVFEDTDGDGNYDKQRTVIDGLNIATSVAVGRGGIWVINPPYLLCYPDADQDAVPDGEPIVHLSGFGLEDTHSVANSLMFAPDGWLYGVNGSTTTAEIQVPLGSQPVTQYQGQCVWRYHPEQHRFEIYAEGGGNPFGLEIDAKGQVFSGTNWGNTRGMYYPQGSYGVKSWGKHGPLTNPYAYGFFSHMKFKGDGRRFTEEFVIYDDDVLPERYRGQMLAINPLQRIAFASNLLPDGSTYKTEDFENLIESDDRWFRPVDATVGPDGLLYIADWYDTRLTHVDPRDNWHKSSGRIYRLSPAAMPEQSQRSAVLPNRTNFNLGELDNSDLMELLGDPSKWVRFAVVEVLAERKEALLAEQLLGIAVDSQDDRALEALWAAARIKGIEQLAQDLDVLNQLLSHPDPDVRRWTIRLLGDQQVNSPQLLPVLQEFAGNERDVRVRSQLASTAARLPNPCGPAVITSMLSANLAEDANDPHIPLLIWWAIENHFESSDQWLNTALEAQPELWRNSIFQDSILWRYAKRCSIDGKQTWLAQCARLLALAPDAKSRASLFQGLEEGLTASTGTEIPDSLAETLEKFRSEMPQTDLKIRLRSGQADAVKEALQAIASNKVLTSNRIELITMLGELQVDGASSMLTRRLNDDSVSVRRAALMALARFSDPEIANAIAAAYQNSMDDSTGLRPIAVRILSSRKPWAERLIQEIDALKIDPELVTPDMVAQMQSFDDETLKDSISRLWGRVRATPEAKQQQIKDLKSMLSSMKGNRTEGKKLFGEHCGKCHRFFGEGGEVGPDLTGYERSNFDFLSLAVVDPSAAIREEFTQYQALTVDGQVVSGLLINQTPQAITIRTSEGQSITLATEQVESLQASPVSLMPEGLLDKLNNQQKVDLFEYLSR